MFRHRSQSVPDVLTPATYLRKSKTGAIEANNSYGPYVTQRDWNEMDDVVVPRFAERIAKGEIINNPLRVWKSKINEELTSATLTSTIGQVAYYDGAWTSMRMVTEPFDRSSYNASVAAWRSLVADTKEIVMAEAIANIDATPYAFAEDLAELHQTMNTLGNPLGSANKAADRFYSKAMKKRGYYLRRGYSLAEATAKAMSDAWLSSRYEFRPIMISMSNILSGLPKIHTRPKRMKAYARKDVETSHNSISVSGQHSLQTRWSATGSIKSYIIYEMSNPIDGRDFDLGVRMKDIPATAWALVPLSFIYDRFYDISTTIKGITNLSDPRLKILTSGCVFSEDISLYEQVNTTAGVGWSGTVSCGPRVTEIHNATRNPWAPSMSDTLPTLTVKKALSDFNNVADLAALVAQKLRLGR